MANIRRFDPGRNLILSRDRDGVQRWLSVVDHPAGFISISDDEFVRILTPSAVSVLVQALIHSMGMYLPVQSGGPE